MDFVPESHEKHERGRGNFEQRLECGREERAAALQPVFAGKDRRLSISGV